MPVTMSAPYTDVLFPSSFPGGYDTYEWTLHPTTDPTPDAYFWAYQIGWDTAGGGYVGMQTLGTGLPGKCLVFSIADALDAVGAGIVTDDFDGGPGYSTRVTYNWRAGRRYRFTLTIGTLDEVGQWWDASVEDLSANIVTPIASIAVPEAWGGLNGYAIAWTERYSPPPDSCGDARLASADFTDFTADSDTPISFTDHYSAGDCPVPENVEFANGRRQRMGTAAEVGVTVDILEADAATLVAAVEASSVVDGEVQDMVHDDSLGRLVVGLESANRDHLAVRGRVLRWNGTGDDPFHSVIEANDQVSITESHSKVPRQITVAGRGLVAQWDDVRVHQWPGMDLTTTDYYTRHFNYASPGKAAEIDGAAYQHDPVLDFDAYGQPTEPDRPPPVTWRDTTAQRIWSTPFSLDQPDGTTLLRAQLTTGTANLILRSHGTADDRMLVWCGGVPILKGLDFPGVTWFETFGASTVLKPSTTYDIVARCENEYTAPGGSAAWFAYAGWLLESEGARLSASNLALHSDASWSGLEVLTDPTPGWTTPELLEVLLTEWQAAGGLTGWAVVDMAADVGVDWVPMMETNFETEKTTGHAVLAQLADGQAEFATRVTAGVKELLCFPPGTMGNYHTSPVSPATPTTAEITRLSFRWVQS